MGDMFEIYKHIIHIAVLIITHYKCMGYVIIPKPNCSNVKFKLSCRRFDLFSHRHFGSFCRRYDRSCRLSGCHRFDVPLAINYLYSAFRLSPLRSVAGDELSIVAVQVVAVST